MKNNLGFKVLAVVLAVFIWLQLNLVSQHRTNTSLKLELVNTSEADAEKQPAEKISCAVAGRGFDILRLKFSYTHLEMVAAEYWAANWHNYRIVDPSHNLKVEILGINPSSQALIAKTGKKPAAKESGSEKPGSSPSDRSGSDKDDTQTRVLRNLPISATGGRTVYPSTATIKVKGPQSRLSSLPSGIVIHVSNKADESGFYSLDVQLPAGITLVEHTPTRVRADK